MSEDKYELSKTKLVDLYIKQKLSIYQIEKLLNIPYYTIHHRMKRYNIKARPDGYYSKGKNYEERFGKENALRIRKSHSKSMTGKKINVSFKRRLI